MKEGVLTLSERAVGGVGEGAVQVATELVVVDGEELAACVVLWWGTHCKDTAVILITKSRIN